MAALLRLSDMNSPDAISILITALDHPDIFVQEKAEEMLIRKKEVVIPELISALDGDDFGLIGSIMLVLGSPGNDVGLRDINRVRDLSLKVLPGISRELSVLLRIAYRDNRYKFSILPFVRVLRELIGGRRIRAIHILGQIGSVSINPLVQALNDGNPVIRTGVISALAIIQHPESVNPLIRSLPQNNAVWPPFTQEPKNNEEDQGYLTPPFSAYGDSSDDASGAAFALSCFGNAILDHLVDSLSDPNPSIRKGVVNVIGNIQDADILPNLALALKDPDSKVRSAAMRALMFRKDPRLTRIFLDAFGHFPKSERFLLIEALKKRMPENKEEIIDALDDPDPLIREGVVQFIGITHYTRVSPVIEKILADDPDLAVRRRAAWCLGLMGNPSSIPILIESVRSGDVETRKMAALSLKSLINSGNTSDPQVINSLIVLLSDTDCTVRQSVEDYLCHMQNLPVQALMDTYDSASPELKKSLTRIFCNNYTPAAVAPILHILKTPYPSLDADKLYSSLRTIERSFLKNDDALRLLKSKYPYVQLWASLHLAETQVEEAYPYIIRAIQDPHDFDEFEAKDAILALTKYGNKAIPILIEALQKPESISPQCCGGRPFRA